MRWIALPGLAAMATLTSLPSSVVAQGWIEGPVRPRVAQVVTRVGATVRATVRGPIATFEVEERYRNDGGGLAEGTYLFPLPGEAVFTDFSLFQGDQELRGEVMTADQARGIYEEIVRRKRDPALLTLAGHGLVRAQVFPIQPGETRKIILRFTQRLERIGDALSLRYALGQRGGAPGGIGFTVSLPEGDRFGRLYSPTHGVQVSARGEGREVRIEHAEQGEVHLLLPLRGRALSASMLTYAPGSREQGFFMLLVTPTAEDASPTPRDLTFVVDVSGSMAGEKLVQAKAALRQALEQLTPADRFQVIAFSSEVNAFRDDAVSATPGTVRQAQAFVEGLTAQGGTNIEGALERALEHQPGAGRTGLVLFLTDGLPSVGEKNPESLGGQAASRIGRLRVFPIGVGHDVNTYLLDRLARDGKGRVDYVAPGESVEHALGRLFTRVSRPALTDLRIVESPLALVDLAPSVLPDVFYGDELVLTGRYSGNASGRIVVEGTRNGRRERLVVPAVFPRRADANRFIATLWASRRIGELSQSMRLEGSRPEIIAQIRELGLRYGVLTEYTSYLVQEPTIMARGRPVPETRAPRPEDQAGRIAVERAVTAQRQSTAKSLGDATFRLDEVVVTGANAVERGLPPARRAGNRLLVFRDSVWTDVGLSDSLKTVEVEAFSPAYFELLRALPELTAVLSEGGTVALAGREVNLRIGTGTKGSITRWAPGAMDRFVRAFRGI